MLLGMTASGGGRLETRPNFSLVLIHAIGGTLGGILVGVALAVSAIVFEHMSLIGRAALVLAVSATMVASDLRAFRLPSWKRQVPPVWTRRFGKRRAFLLYGVVLGSGITTFVPWGAMYVAFAGAMLLGSFKIAVLAGSLFGLARTLSSGLGSFSPTPISFILYRSVGASRLPRTMSVGVAVMVAGISTVVIASSDVAEGGTRMTSVTDTSVDYGGLRMTVPAGWSSRVLYLDYRATSFMMQAANFTLPPQEGLKPPPELPAGVEDPIASMTGADILISVIPAGMTGDSGNNRSVTRMNLRTSGRVMKDMSMATARRQIAGRLWDIEVTFGSINPSDAAIGTANAIIESVSAT